ncbi:MAG TPA: leucyl aminopeptidase, partial [Acidimicrobiales bacterium]|nr:leucyl aminopeptidase [Acidimicrobiales bacterium]
SGRAAKGVPGVALEPSYLTLRGFEGKPGQTLALPGSDGQVVVAVGIGKAADLTVDTVRRAAAALVRAAGKATSAALVLGSSPLDPRQVGQAVAEGAVMGSYRFDSFRSRAEDGQNLTSLTLVGSRPRDAAAGAERGTVVGRAVALARDLVNTPPGAMTPTVLADVAGELAGQASLEAEILDEEAILAERLGGLAGVAAGSDQPPRLIRLTYDPPGATSTLALVGKGITFDSGGLSLKTADGMMTMKTDMSGAAAVLATMSVLAELGATSRVIGIMPATENMPGGRAIKPGDVLRARNGKTIEVLNTDAEGRLVLADGLSLAVEAGATAIVDIATLTGACVVALGRRVAGLMGNHDGFLGQVEQASRQAGESLWRLPLPAEYRKDLDSEVADIKNIGAAGQAGALAAGLFLKEFVGGVPWAHLDIAGPARSDSADGYLTKGGTGFGTRTLIELATTFSPPA